MKLGSPVLFAGALAAVLVHAGSTPAQATTPASARPAAPTARASAALPKPVIAVLDSSVFPDQVFEIKAEIDKLRVQFDARNKEVQALVDRMTALEGQAKQGTATPQQQEQMAQQYAQLKREAERKGQDLDAEKQRAFQTSMTPIRTKMNVFLRQFSATRGITLVLELNVAMQSKQIFYVSESADITKAFVAEYNKANPAR